MSPAKKPTVKETADIERRKREIELVDESTALEIVDYDHPALREDSLEVVPAHITEPHIQKLVTQMKKTLATQSDGVGLAAPQIGVPLRVFIVSKHVFERQDEAKSGAASTAAEKIATPKTKPEVYTDLVCINPVITKFSKEKRWMDGEGCLSVRWLYGRVQRSTRVTLRAYDENGKAFERGASGLLAHIFQHEVDHLNGILFIDKAKDIEEMTEEEINTQIAQK